MMKAPRRVRSNSLLLIVNFNFLHEPPALFGFKSKSLDHPATAKPLQFSLTEPVAYEES